MGREEEKPTKLFIFFFYFSQKLKPQKQQQKIAGSKKVFVLMLSLSLLFDRITQSYGERIQEKTQKKKVFNVKD